MRTIALLAAVALLPGCFIAPAMNMDEAAAVKRGRDKTKDGRVIICDENAS